MFDKLINNLEKYILRFLIVIILIYISFEIINLLHELFFVIIDFDFGLSKVSNYPFVDVVLIFFDILIALEFMETLKHNADTVAEKAKIIILIGLIAVSRKLITIDIAGVDYTTDIALALLIMTLTAGYFLLSNKRNSNK